MLLPVLMLAAPLAPRAEIVRGLYSAEVPVADQSAQALSRASRVALAEVLVKVSGSSDVLQYPVIKAALPEARAHVQQYAYRQAREPGGQLSVRLEFDDSYVTRLVTTAGAPLWTANRPVVLVWLVVEDGGPRYFVSQESAPELAQQLLQAFARRGVPARLPLYDLADAAALNTEEAWRLYAPALQAASGRYDVEDVLAGRAAALTSGEVVGDWSYFDGVSRSDRSFTAPDTEAFMRSGVSIVAEKLAARYAVAPSGAAEGGIRMSVVGVSTYSDYANIVAWLEGLELIDHANVERVEGDTLELRLHAQADAGQLAAIIELNQRLVPQPVAASENVLNYQWQK
jgi:hypothetical protein